MTTTVCTKEACDRPVLCRKLCRTHYEHWRRSQLPVCTVESCTTKSISHGLCTKHGKKKVQPLCTVQDCTKPINRANLCYKHYRLSREDLKPRCSVEGCAKPQRTNKMCTTHYARHLRANNYPCSVEGCAKPHYGNGYCTMHYQRFFKTGDAGEGLSRQPTRGMETEERFQYYVDITDDETSCWLWAGRLDEGGYGRFDLEQGDKKHIGSHRYSYCLSHSIPLDQIDNLHIHHKCAERACVRPDHLELSTARENIGEMLARRNYVHGISTAIKAIESLDPDHPDLPMLRSLIK